MHLSEVLRLYLNVGQSWIGNVGDDPCWLVMSAMDRVQMDFGFSFDAMPTIDMVLYFRRLMKKDGDGQS